MKLDVTGYVDLSSAPILDEAGAEVLAESPQVLIIDLTGVDFLGSGGLAILARAHSVLNPPARLVVVANEITARPFELTGLDKLFAVRRALEDAFD